MRRSFFLAAVAVVPAAAVFAQTSGILLMAHGGRENWNEEIRKIAAAVDKSAPVEVAFGMASRASLQSAVDKLIGRGVKEIVAVPLFVSSHSSVITSTEFLLGQRKEAPKELAIYARMNHGHTGHTARAGDSKGATPVESAVPIRMTRAVDGDEVAAAILLDRANALSREPSKEAVILVAHGPVSDAENAKWLDEMKLLHDFIQARSSYARIEYLTVRDDAPEPIRSQAAAELRAVVERASAAGERVLVIPLLMAYGGIEGGIRKRLSGLQFEMASQGLLPDDRLIAWVLKRAGR